MFFPLPTRGIIDFVCQKMHNNAYNLELTMRTTINIEDELIEKAAKLTGVKEKTALVRLGLKTLIAVESSKRLAKLGGTEKQLQPIPRRKAAI